MWHSCLLQSRSLTQGAFEVVESKYMKKRVLGRIVNGGVKETRFIISLVHCIPLSRQREIECH